MRPSHGRFGHPSLYLLTHRPQRNTQQLFVKHTAPHTHTCCSQSATLRRTCRIEPPVLFSIGCTASSTSPCSSASNAMSNRSQGYSCRPGHATSAATSVYAPAQPWWATRRAGGAAWRTALTASAAVRNARVALAGCGVRGGTRWRKGTGGEVVAGKSGVAGAKLGEEQSEASWMAGQSWVAGAKLGGGSK
eukprot:363815-Chlamydomonas_euryale.AAC.6